MRPLRKKYFTIPEVTMAIAILGMGMVSILATFPPIFKVAFSALEVSKNSIKLRSLASLYDNFSASASDTNPVFQAKELKASFATGAISTWIDDGVDSMDITVNHKANIPDVLKVNGVEVLDLFGKKVKGVSNVKYFLNGKMSLDRVALSINDEVNTIIYSIRKK